VRCEVDKLKSELEEAATRTAEVGCVCWRVRAYADVCVCSRMLLCRRLRMLTYAYMQLQRALEEAATSNAEVGAQAQARMLTYADVC
jgi:hypothetical protein